VFALLQVQPLLTSNKLEKEPVCVPTAIESCAKKKAPACSRGKCTLPTPSGEPEDCNSNGCNPFVPCSIGFCCYLVEGFYAYAAFSLASKQQLMLFDDNRIASALSECWHPPELIS
jgi:hypothetical protein